MIVRYLALSIIVQLAHGAIIDRIAIVAGKKIIKDSDISNDLRLTAFLNQEAIASTAAARKKSASRLLDQVFIGEQLEAGVYPKTSVEETQQTLNSLIKTRYPSTAAYKAALATYGLTEEELKSRLMWQLTVLRFIDARFRSSTYITDDAIRDYYEAHRSVFKADLAESHAKIQEILSGEETNKAFYEWLDRHRQQAAIRYVEEGLK